MNKRSRASAFLLGERVVLLQKLPSAVLKTSGVECGFAVPSPVSGCGALTERRYCLTAAHAPPP